MGRACVCCGDECLNDVIHINVDRYAPGIRSFVETITEIYEVKVSTNSFFNAPTSIELISSDTKRTIDNSPFVSNTFRTEKVSSEVISEDGKRLTVETWEKTTVIRKLALSFNVGDVFDWEKENKHGIKFIDSIYFRLGDTDKKNMSGLNGWAARSGKDENTTSVFSGIIYGQDLPSDVSSFDSLFSDGEYQFDITGMGEHAAVDVDDFFERGNTKYLILLQPQDKELQDGFLDQEPNEDGEYKRLIETGSDKKPGSLVGLGRWRRGDAEQKIWLELIRPGSRGAANSQSSMDSEAQYWLNDTGNILYDWHDCFERIAEAEYVSTCKYMDVYFDFGVFDDIYFKEGSKLEIELFKAKTSNTKLGARKTEALLLYELVVGDNVVKEIPNGSIPLNGYYTGIAQSPDPYRLSSTDIEYRFNTNEGFDSDCYSEHQLMETKPISEWGSFLTQKIEEDCTIGLVGEIPELSVCYIDNQYNTYKLKYKELFEWDLKYSIDGIKSLIMTKYTNSCDSLESESQIGCDGLNICSFVENNPVTDRVGPIFIRDCVIETTPGYYIEDGYTHRYEAKHPIHGSYNPLNVRFQLIDHQYYPNVYSSFTGYRFGGISIQEVKNTRTSNNPDCPVIECVGGPAILEWEIKEQSPPDGDNWSRLANYSTTIYGYGTGCKTKIISTRGKREFERFGIAGLETVTTAEWAVQRIVPSAEEFYVISGMSAAGTYCDDVRSWVPDPIPGPFDLPFGEYTRVCDTTISIGIGFGGGGLSTSTPCRDFDLLTSVINGEFCSGYGAMATVFQTGEFFNLVKAGHVTHSAILGLGSYPRNTEIFYTSVEPSVYRGFIFDQLVSTEAISEEKTNYDYSYNDIIETRSEEYSVIHDIAVTDEPVFFNSDFNVFFKYYDGDFREFILGADRSLSFNNVLGDSYITGEGIRFRLNEDFKERYCDWQRIIDFVVEDEFSTFSDFDPKYQSYAPVIIQDAQLDEDQIGEIAGYLTDFDYWYQIKGTFFIEDEEGVDLSEDDEGNIIVGTYVTDKWFYIDGAGNINGPFDSSGFVETLPDFAVYDKVEIYYDGLAREVETNPYSVNYAGGERDDDYSREFGATGENYSCIAHFFNDRDAGFRTGALGYLEEPLITDAFLPKIDVLAPDLRLKNERCAVSPFDTCQIPLPVNHRKIADAWFTSPPERVESTATISRTYTGDTALPLPQDNVGWNYREAGDRCRSDECLGYCPVSNIYGQIPNSCQRTIGVWKKDPTMGYETLDFGESININFEIPVRGLNVPTEEFDYTYSTDISEEAFETLNSYDTGFVVPEAVAVYYYKKTVPRFSCDNLPEVSFSNKDLILYCQGRSSQVSQNYTAVSGGVGLLWDVTSYSYPSFRNELAVVEWEETKRHGVPRRGRWDQWLDIVLSIEDAIGDVYQVIKNKVSPSLGRIRSYECDNFPAAGFSFHDDIFGPVRIDDGEDENDYLGNSFQIDNYGLDKTYWTAYKDVENILRDAGIDIDVVGGLMNYFDEMILNIESSNLIDWCYYLRSLFPGTSAPFGYDPPDWNTFCPHQRPSTELPGDEYRKWSEWSEFDFKEGCGSDRGGKFKYSLVGPSLLSPYSGKNLGKAKYGTECLQDYTRCYGYYKAEMDYSFTIKGKNSVEE